MSSHSISPAKICAGYEPFPGYVLEANIGRGGFGEVWRANAPGNLKKAIKFVFGNHNDSRASRELRSLERVKAVRHPFLLTLERFEIVDNQLVIVTELADGSLEDIFKRHRESGSCGIPRNVLLKNLIDTADGLDYLHTQYQLQHLDIKPANLLMIGGHVKVADFGLLKDLRDVDCSVVGGLTPIYAPPELFDGRPSLHSDQYSLAVMYQEMLTGTRPFAGRTIAQLATQHIHSTPNLEPLPPRDRGIVAKALEKDPSRRFDSCSEFVECLRDSKRVSTTGINQDDPSEVDHRPSRPQIEDLPQLGSDVPQNLTCLSSRALIIAIGGMGAEVVSELRRKATSMHLACPLQLNTVLIDTDRQSIYSARTIEPTSRVPSCVTIHTPLKSPNEYRDSVTERLRTISRRWIYNVPRSGKTDGLRPVGRLAMVDHGPTISKQLQEVIGLIAAQGTKEPLHVYVVGSIAGGTGSGMYIDVVHQLRHLLDEAQFHDAKILSLLGTMPLRGDAQAALPCHNTHAALIEMRHFLQAGNGYPGDSGATFASVPAARTPLRDVYLISGSPTEKFARPPVQTMVDYLWTDATGAGSLLEQARKMRESESSKLPQASVRTVGIIPLGESHSLEEQLLGPSVVYQVLLEWLGNPSAAVTQAEPVADRIARRIGLTIPFVMGSILETVSDRNETGRCIVAERLRSSKTDGCLDFIAGSLTNQLHREISIALGDRKYNVATILESLSRLRKLCEKIPTDWMAALDPNDSDTRKHAEEIVGLASISLQRIIEECDYLQSRMECLAAILAVAVVETKKKFGGQDPWAEMPQRIAARKESVVNQLHQATVNTHLVRPLNDVDSNLDSGSLVEHLSEVALPYVVSLLQQNADAFDVGGSSLEMKSTAANSNEYNATQTLGATQLPPSRASIDATQQLPNEKTENADVTALSVQDAVALVRPSLIEFGGSQRLVLVVGSAAQRSQFETKIRELHSGTLSVAIIDGMEPTLIYEAQQISLDAILTRLEVLNGDTATITGRLASRIDVTWKVK
jgi:eukaryotic-like serine/threonine-protein kinase